MTRTGSRPNLFAVPGQPFGKGRVIDPEVRVPDTSGRLVRCARLRCECGTIYVAELRKLYSGERKSCGCMRRGRARNPAGRVHRNQGGWTVWVYCGWYKSRAEAEDVARRSRAVVLPAVKDRPAAL